MVGFQVSGLDSGFRAQGSGFKVLGAGCRFQRSVFGCQGLGFRVRGGPPGAKSECRGGKPRERSRVQPTAYLRGI